MSTVVGGAKCYAIGSPQRLQNTISEGIISNPSQVLGGMTYIQTTAAISHGSSGGALINKYGQVIGITSGGISEGENLGFAIPISVINGYSHDQYTDLSVLFSHTPTAEEAYNYLVAFVEFYYNETSSSTIAYSETEYTSTGSIERSIRYNQTDGMLYVQRVQISNDQEYWTSIVYYVDSFTHLVVYGFYDSPSSTSFAVKAASYLYAPGFYGDNLIFNTVDINTGYDISLNESFASYFAQDALYFTDYIFARYLSDFGDFGVYLFGFTNYAES